MTSGKTASEYGRLWGCPDKDAEKEYVNRIKDLFEDERLASGGKKPTVLTGSSQLIEYPEEGLQCIQTETWIRLKTEAGDESTQALSAD